MDIGRPEDAEGDMSTPRASSPVHPDPARGEDLRKLYDGINFRRDERRQQLVESVSALIASSGLSIATPSDRLVHDVLEGGADEDEPKLHRLWTNLLAHTLTDAENVPRAFPELLRQLEPVEARLLQELAVQEPKHLPGSWVEFHELATVPDQVEWRHLDNLERLALLQFETSYPNNVDLPARPPRDSMQIRFALTPLGLAFLAACAAPGRAHLTE